MVKLNSNYFNSLIFSTVTISQLPMIVEPRKVGPEGIYFPYIQANTNVLILNEKKIIKGK